jgi:flavodoxin
MKNLVIYYSRSGENYVNGKVTNIAKGNTEYVAEFIRDNFGADLFKAETVKEYAKSYMDCIREAQKELDHDERPELKKYLKENLQRELSRMFLMKQELLQLRE